MILVAVLVRVLFRLGAGLNFEASKIEVFAGVKIEK
jgi:hypothetical protein